MSRSGAMWPTWLWFDEDFKKLSEGAQRQFNFMWTHPQTNSAGFLPLQEEPWSRLAADLTVDKLKSRNDELLALRWIALDPDAGWVYLIPFLRIDSCKKPWVYVAALRDILNNPSAPLRLEAWAEVQAVHPPPLKPPDDDASEKALEWYRNQIQTRDEAYQELRSHITGEPFENRSRTVREPISVSGPVSGSESGVTRPALCSRCGRYPPMERGLCGACLGRELLDEADRDGYEQ
jgi:hypothetical protein